MARGKSVIAVFFFFFNTISLACVPPPAVECISDYGCAESCEIFNSQGVWEDLGSCRAAAAVFPRTEAELVLAVATAVKQKQKIKVVSRFSHSLTHLVCVGEDGLIISTKDYDSKIHVNKSAMTITVDPGVMMRDVIDAAAEEGLALTAMIYWDGVSAAGVVSTGAHGSGIIGRGSAVHEYVRGLRIVVPAPAEESYAKVVRISREENEEEFNAAVLSLGVLGAISEITFGLEPMFKRSVSMKLVDDDGMEDMIIDFVKKHEFADAWWYLAHGKLLLMEIDRVGVDVNGNGVNKLQQLGQPTSVAEAEEIGTTLNMIESTRATTLLCNLTETMMNARVSTGAGFLNDENLGFLKYPVIGFNNRMQATGGCQHYSHTQEPNPMICTPDRILDQNQSICSWDRRANGVKGFDLEIYVPLRNLREAILDMKKIRDLNPQSLCELEFVEGVTMRTVKKSEAFLGHSEDVITFEFEYLRSTHWGTPKWNMDIYDEIEQMLVEKHGATLHWGKSGGYLFDGTGRRAVSLDKFVQVKNRMDPHGVFSNDWTDGVLGIGGKTVQVFRDGCGLHKMCKCSEDRHCAPHKGYFCRPGRVWKEARVCRQDTSSSKSGEKGEYTL
uniref:L-gulonolactone oxidase n=1 Tax=Araucaria cunninghamii TaxID=56994 RepID=A0A0D6R656_ARACU